MNYSYDPTPYIVLNAVRDIKCIPFKRENELYLFHGCNKASEDTLMTLLTMEHPNLESTLEYCYDDSKLINVPKGIIVELPMRITPKYELFDTNSDLQMMLKWFQQLCLAVEYMHSEDIIHSNIHPTSCSIYNGNLVLGELQDIIVPDSKYNILKIRQNTLAPEVLHEDLHPIVSKKMDIFMLGICLFEWLDTYLCIIKPLPESYLPSMLDSFIERLKDFMEIDCIEHADLFPPLFKMISQLLIDLFEPDYAQRKDVHQILNHNLFSIIKKPHFILSTWFAGLKRNEWLERNIKLQFEKRHKLAASPSTLWFKF